MGDFEGRVAIVTGAWRGIGRATVRALVARGARVAVNVRDPDRAEMAARAEGPRAMAAPADVTDAAQVHRMVSGVLDRWGRVDVLVNNAAFAAGTALAELEEAEWRRALDVNATGPFLCLKAVLPAMRRAGYGRVVNVASTAGKTASTLGGPHYTASKHALLGLTRAAARELGPLGITVNAVCPGITDTELVREVGDPDRVRQIAATAIPIRRLGRPEEVADLVCFVAGEAAAAITGAALDVNGGIFLA